MGAIAGDTDRRRANLLVMNIRVALYTWVPLPIRARALLFAEPNLYICYFYLKYEHMRRQVALAPQS